MGQINKTKILIVDDEPGLLEVCKESLGKNHAIEIATLSDGRDVLELIKKEHFDLLLVDLRMAFLDGMTVLQQAKHQSPDLDVVMMTAFPSVNSAVTAIKSGATDYLIKPFTPEQLRLAVSRVLKQRELIEHSRLLSAEIEKKHYTSVIIGENAAMMEIFDLVQKAAPGHSEICITGEKGTGKNLIARQIHSLSQRAQERFVPVHCSNTSETLLESELFGYEKDAFPGAHAATPGLLSYANGGTLFLDEVCDLPLRLQTKLMEVLTEKCFLSFGGKIKKSTDVRILASSSKNLSEELREGRFQSDLYYRLNVIAMHLPPLRDRQDDIPQLVAHFIKSHATDSNKPAKNLSADAMEVLINYPWPGNVRELQNVIQKIVTLARGTEIHADDLPEEILMTSHANFKNESSGFFAEREQHLVQFEIQYLKRLLKENHGDVAAASIKAKIPRGTFYRFLKKHALSPGEFK